MIRSAPESLPTKERSKESNSLKQEAIEFPTLFPIKVIGRQSSEFQAMVVEVMRRHVADLDEGTIHLRASAGGRYISLTATFTATSREQLDALYQELGRLDQVVMLL